MAASATGASGVRWFVVGNQGVSREQDVSKEIASKLEIAGKMVAILIDQERKPEVQVSDVRSLLEAYTEEQRPSHKELIAVILNDTAKEPAVRLRDIRLLLSSGLRPFTAEGLPPPGYFGLSQATYLDIYWWMLGRERGKPLTAKEAAWHIPPKSNVGSIGCDSLSEYVCSLRVSDGCLPDCGDAGSDW